MTTPQYGSEPSCLKYVFYLSIGKHNCKGIILFWGQLMRYTNLFPFRGAGRLDGKPHLSLNPAGDGHRARKQNVLGIMAHILLSVYAWNRLYVL